MVTREFATAVCGLPLELTTAEEEQYWKFLDQWGTVCTQCHVFYLNSYFAYNVEIVFFLYKYSHFRIAKIRSYQKQQTHCTMYFKVFSMLCKKALYILRFQYLSFTNCILKINLSRASLYPSKLDPETWSVQHRANPVFISTYFQR